MFSPFFLLPALVLFFIGFLWWWHPSSTDKPHYVSSFQCQQCHPSHYAGWQSSSHSKIFHPVNNHNILADFSLDDPALTFSKEDVDFVVGSKWEQVYVQLIDGEYFPLPAKWIIAKKQWEPYKIDSWQDTPMSKKCNGCHVTGFEAVTFKFNEYSIGCEACHGPGSIHVNNHKIINSQSCSICHKKSRMTKDDIVRTVSSAVCGQCHNRGKSIPDSAGKQESFNFPVNMSPGESISSSFIPVTPKKDKKNKYWWGNGVAKKRHQEFAEWEKSNHALSLKRMNELYSPKKGQISVRCLSCHSADYILTKSGQKPDLHSAIYGVTCAVCHNSHGTYNSSPAQQQSGSCRTCHNTTHSSCPSPSRQAHYPCPIDKVQCEDCHMPYTIKNAGSFSIRSHGFRIVSPSETRKFKVPNSCQNGGCHQNKNLEWIENQFNAFYPEFSSGTK